MQLSFAMQISDDAMAHVKSVKSGQFLQTYSVRCAAVAAWCDAQTPESIRLFLSSRQIELTSGLRLGPPGHPYRGRYSTHELHDAFGPSITDPSYTAITCSEETKEGCVSINSRRASAGMAPLEIVVAPLVVGPSGSKLSSTDLRARASQDGATRSTPLQPAAGHG